MTKTVKRILTNQVRAEEFVRTWQNAANAAEVGAALGVPAKTAAGTAQLLRRRGVPLKKMTPGFVNRLDYDLLAEVAVES